MIDFDTYTKLENEWYNQKQPLVETGKYKEAISITENYLERLSGDYGQEWSGKLGKQLLTSLINISHKIKDYDYALQKCVELSKIDFNKILGHDGGWAEFYLGATYYELGNMEKAKEYLLIAKKKSGGRCMSLLGTDKYKQFLKSCEPSKEQVKMQKAFDKLSKLFKDEEITEDIDLFIKNMVKSGFFSEEDMLIGLRNFVEYNYEDCSSKLKSKQLPSILSLYNEVYSNKKEPVNFRKLDAAFHQLAQNGFVVQHAIGNTDDEGFEECKDEAMHHDREAWKSFTITEARRIKQFLGLPEHAGLEGLAKALQLRFYANINNDEIILGKDNKTLVYRTLECHVQTARKRKQMEYHPCKSVGIIEYSGFAKTIDERITCECLSCYPDITDNSCCCAWQFTLNE